MSTNSQQAEKGEMRGDKRISVREGASVQNTDISEGMRNVLRRFPTGVVAVTYLIDNRPNGATMNSFTSISLNPPLIALFITDRTRSVEAIRACGNFVINILKSDQQWIAQKLAGPYSEDKFTDIEWRKGYFGTPIIENSLAYIEAKVVGDQTIADHVFFVGEAINAQVLSESKPLVYHMRTYLTI